MNVQARIERHGSQVQGIELKEVKVVDLLVAQEEVAASAGELLLHQLLDTNILDHVGDTLQLVDLVPIGFGSVKESTGQLVRSPQGVTDLMGDQHGLHRFGNLPNGHDEVPGLHIE